MGCYMEISVVTCKNCSGNAMLQLYTVKPERECRWRPGGHLDGRLDGHPDGRPDGPPDGAVLTAIRAAVKTAVSTVSTAVLTAESFVQLTESSVQLMDRRPKLCSIETSYVQLKRRPARDKKNATTGMLNVEL